MQLGVVTRPTFWKLTDDFSAIYGFGTTLRITFELALEGGVGGLCASGRLELSLR